MNYAKMKLTALACILSLGASICTSNAWYNYGYVRCDANQSHVYDVSDPGVQSLLVVTTNISGTYSNANWTEASGFFIVQCSNSDTYVSYIHPATLPPGTTEVLPQTWTFTLTDTSDMASNNFLIENDGCVSAVACGPMETSINADIGGASIAEGNTIWLDAIADFSGVDVTNGTIVSFKSATITSDQINVAVPDTTITFSTNATNSTVFYDTNANAWSVTVPVTTKRDIFFGGVPFLATNNIQVGRNDELTWTGYFYSSTEAVSASWKFGAAIYNTARYSDLFANLNEDDILAVAGTGRNSDDAGTPEGIVGGVTIKNTTVGGGGYCGAGHVAAFYTTNAITGCGTPTRNPAPTHCAPGWHWDTFPGDGRCGISGGFTNYPGGLTNTIYGWCGYGCGESGEGGHAGQSGQGGQCGSQGGYAGQAGQGGCNTGGRGR